MDLLPFSDSVTNHLRSLGAAGANASQHSARRISRSCYCSRSIPGWPGPSGPAQIRRGQEATRLGEGVRVDRDARLRLELSTPRALYVKKTLPVRTSRSAESQFLPGMASGALHGSSEGVVYLEWAFPLDPLNAEVQRALICMRQTMLGGAPRVTTDIRRLLR